MKRPEVKKALHELIASIQPETDTENIFRLLHDLFLQASYNPADIVDENGQLIKPLAELGELSKCIAQIIPIGDDSTRIVLIDRDKAQTKLMKYYNLIRDTPEIKAEMPVIMLTDKENNVDKWNAQNAPQTSEDEKGEP